MLVGASHRGIEQDDRQFDALEPLQQPQEVPPDPAVDPAWPAPVARLPATIGLRPIPPRRARAQNGQNTLSRLAVLDLRRPPPAVVLGRQPSVDLLNLLVRKVIPTIHAQPLQPYDDS